MPLKVLISMILFRVDVCVCVGIAVDVYFGFHVGDLVVCIPSINVITSFRFKCSVFSVDFYRLISLPLHHHQADGEQ